MATQGTATSVSAAERAKILVRSLGAQGAIAFEDCDGLLERISKADGQSAWVQAFNALAVAVGGVDRTT